MTTSYSQRLIEMHEAITGAIDVFCASPEAEVLGSRIRRFEEYEAPTLPAVVVGTARFDGGDMPYRRPGEAFEPTDAQVPIWIMVPSDKRAAQNLYTVLPLIAAALDDLTDAVVVSAGPGRYPSPADQKEFPAYEVIVEYAV